MMADQTAHELAELLCNVIPGFPWDASADDGDGCRVVTLIGRRGDRLIATWPLDPPTPGDDVSLHLSIGGGVYEASTHVTGLESRTGRFLTVTGLRRKTQRRGAARAQVEDLVVVSHDGDVDAMLLDVSADGVAFELDRPLPLDATIRAVLNFHGVVIPTTAQVKNSKPTGDASYRVGCAILQIADHHKAALRDYAEKHPIDRRSPHSRAGQRLGFLRTLRTPK
jgi:hypothetical protein